jgi:hypothetical protein
MAAACGGCARIGAHARFAAMPIGQTMLSVRALNEDLHHIAGGAF